MESVNRGARQAGAPVDRAGDRCPSSRASTRSSISASISGTSSRARRCSSKRAQQAFVCLPGGFRHPRRTVRGVDPGPDEQRSHSSPSSWWAPSSGAGWCSGSAPPRRRGDDRPADADLISVVDTPRRSSRSFKRLGRPGRATGGGRLRCTARRAPCRRVTWIWPPSWAPPGIVRAHPGQRWRQRIDDGRVARSTRAAGGEPSGSSRVTSSIGEAADTDSDELIVTETMRERKRLMGGARRRFHHPARWDRHARGAVRDVDGRVLGSDKPVVLLDAGRLLPTDAAMAGLPARRGDSSLRPRSSGCWSPDRWPIP